MITNTYIKTNIFDSMEKNAVSYDIDSLHRFPLIKKVLVPPSIYM